MTSKSNLSAFRLILRLFPWARRYLGLIAVTMVFTAAYTGSYNARLLLLEPLFRKILPNSPAGSVAPSRFFALFSEFSTTGLIGLGLVMSLGVAVFEYVQTYLQHVVSLRIIIDIRESVCRHLLGLSMRFFADRKSGDLISRVTNDVAVSHEGLKYFFDDFFRNGFMILSALAVAATACWQLTLFAFLGLPLFVWPIVRIGRRIRKSRRSSLRSLGDVTEDMNQMFSGIRTVKSFRMEEREIEEFRGINEEFRDHSLKVVRAKALSGSVMELLQSLAILGLACAGFWLIENRVFGLTLGTFGVFFAACATINRPAKALAKSFNGIQEAASGCDRLFELLDQKPEIVEETDARDLPAAIRGLEVRRVTFGYNHEPVLKDVSFAVPPGEVPAIGGHSGAGKTTLLDLIARFYDPGEGAIFINGIDLRKIRRASLVDHLAIVAQDPFLFHTTIGTNIRYGRPAASTEEVTGAAKAAHIHDFITSLEKGYETVVGERGTKLSGGQRQRITIARAILKDPSILLLDEATSALDAESERAVQEALANLMKGRITFVIAHRHSTVQKADRIVVLRRGEMVESGTHGELIERPEGEYARIYKTQLMD